MPASIRLGLQAVCTAQARASRLRYTHVLVHTMAGGQTQVNIAMRVHLQPMCVPDGPLGHYCPVGIANAESRWLAGGGLLAAIKGAILATDGEEPASRSCVRHVPECNATRGRENAPGALEGRSIAEHTKEVLRWNVQNQMRSLVTTAQAPNSRC